MMTDGQAAGPAMGVPASSFQLPATSHQTTGFFLLLVTASAPSPPLSIWNTFVCDVILEHFFKDGNAIAT